VTASRVGDASVSTPPATATGLSPRALSVLAYCAWWVSGALVLVLEPRHRDVRFHARQALIGFGAVWAAGVALWAVSFVLAFVSPLAFRAVTLLAQVLWVVAVLLTIVCVVKAWQGQCWPLPWIGRR
jgi:uncharacterized membrane protein